MGDTQNFKNLVEMQETGCKVNANKDFLGTKPTGASSFEYITYGDFGKLVDDLRGGLSALGVEKNDKIGIISTNSTEWAAAAYATYGLNACFIPMYENQMPKELEYILNDAGVTIVFTNGDAVTDKVKGFQTKVKTLKNIINIQGPESSADSFKGLVKAGKAKPVPSKSPDTDDIMGFIYTSGTTGNPKGVMLSHGNIISNLLSSASVFDLGSEESTLSFLPWAHIFGQAVELHMLMLKGMTTTFVESVDKLLDNLAEVKPTVLVAVPRIFEKIYVGVKVKMNASPGPVKFLFYRGMGLATMKKKGENLGFFGGLILGIADKIVFSKIRDRFGGRMKFAFSGSAALNNEVAEFVDNLGITVYEGYGLSETSPMVTINSPIGGVKLGTVGRPGKGIKIEFDKSKVGENSKDGEIVVYGPNVMKGYHNLPEATAEAIDKDGGFHTGDLGRFDEDGYLIITGRIKEQYKLQNGKYCVPSPLEEALKLSVYFDNLLIYGDNKVFNIVIISLDMEMIGKFASENGITDTGDALTTNQKIIDLVESEIKIYSKEMKGYEVPRKFKLLTDQWTGDNGLVTQTMKLRRKVVEKKYMDEIEKLYA